MGFFLVQVWWARLTSVLLARRSCKVVDGGLGIKICLLLDVAAVTSRKEGAKLHLDNPQLDVTSSTERVSSNSIY